MTITRLAMAVCLAATIAPASPAEQKLVVYVQDRAAVNLIIRNRAEALTATMFANIGIRLEWRNREPVNPPSDARYVVVELATGTPADRSPDALACALPYEGVHIKVFYDRIQADIAPHRLLAHVMAHEIAHLLQGINRHSEAGVMKAHWAAGELADMRYKPLPFTREDVALIQAGLARSADTDKPVAGGI